MISGITIDLCDPDYIGGEEPDKKNDKGIRELLSLIFSGRTMSIAKNKGKPWLSCPTS
jgi:hypothetical protein